MSKIGRNDNCPCNSGKKYKKCCQNVTAQQIDNWYENWMKREIERWDKYAKENNISEPGETIKQYKQYFADKEQYEKDTPKRMKEAQALLDLFSNKNPYMTSYLGR